MDGLKKKVGSIESSLHGSRRLLEKHEKQASTEIGSEVVGMRDALVQGGQRIEHITTEVDSFMQSIEYHEPHALSLKPQISWLSSNITTLLGDFESAEAQANEAIVKTMRYQERVNDVAQDIAVREGELDEGRSQGQQLSSAAEQQLKQSEKLIEDTKASVAQKTREIATKTSEAASLRAKLQEYKKTLQQKDSALAEAKRKAEKKKDKAFMGVGAGLLGIGLAPFTGGLSLALTAVGAGVGVGMGIEYDDLKVQINSISSSMATVNTQISEAEASSARLTREKAELEARIKSLQTNITAQKASQRFNQAQISNASRVQSSISELQAHANSTVHSVYDVAAELQTIKEGLDMCAASLSGETARVKVNSSRVDMFLRRKSRNAREFQREKTAIQEAVTLLSAVHAKVTHYVLPRTEMKYLEMKPKGQKATVSVIESTIPQAVLRARV